MCKKKLNLKKKKINFNSRSALYDVFQSKKKNNRIKIESFKSHVSLVLAVVKVLNKTELIDECINYKDNDTDDEITYSKTVLKTFDVTKLRKILIMLLKLYDKFNELVSDSPIVKNEDGIQTMETSASVSNDSNISEVTTPTLQSSAGTRTRFHCQAVNTIRFLSDEFTPRPIRS